MWFYSKRAYFYSKALLYVQLSLCFLPFSTSHTFNSQRLIRGSKLELRRLFPYTLKTLPNRSHLPFTRQLKASIAHDKCLLLSSTIVDNLSLQLCCRVFLISHRIIFVLVDQRSVNPNIPESGYPQCYQRPGLFSNHGIRHISDLRLPDFGFLFSFTGEVSALKWSCS